MYKLFYRKLLLTSQCDSVEARSLEGDWRCEITTISPAIKPGTAWESHVTIMEGSNNRPGPGPGKGRKKSCGRK